MKIGKSEVHSLTQDEKVSIAKHPMNQGHIRDILGMCMPHSRMSDLDDNQLAMLVDALFTLSPTCKLMK